MARRPEGPGIGRLTGAGPALAAVATRPRLWPVGLRQLRRLAVPGWWRRPPFLPLPDRAYLGFRMETMYGDPGHRLEPGDVVAWLEWCAAFDDRTRSAAGAGTSSRSRRR